METDIRELIWAVGQLQGSIGEIKDGVNDIKKLQQEDSGRITRLETRVTLTQLWCTPIAALGGVLGSILSRFGLGDLVGQ